MGVIGEWGWSIGLFIVEVGNPMPSYIGSKISDIV